MTGPPSVWRWWWWRRRYAHNGSHYADEQHDVLFKTLICTSYQLVVVTVITTHNISSDVFVSLHLTATAARTLHILALSLLICREHS